MKENPDSGSDRRDEQEPLRFLVGCETLVDKLFSESGGCAWGLGQEDLVFALERSAAKRFSSHQDHIVPEKLEQYLATLHVKDLALASACANGNPEAWEHFVATYRGYLRAAAAVILRSSAHAAEACELADSLFAELYGLREGSRGERSLFRYFHGRSSLKTWLRAILAQRHIDRIRAGRRFVELPNEGDGPDGIRQSVPERGTAELPADPHRERYQRLFLRALEVALAGLQSPDTDRLRLYYAEEKTLAEIGRKLNEHESSVSRNLERIRRKLRSDVEQLLRGGSAAANASSGQRGLGDAEIALCFQYAAENAAVDFERIFRRPTAGSPKPEKQNP